MNDRDLENVKKYDVVIERIVKGRGGAILWTNKGCKLFLECQKSDYIYVKEDAFTRALIESGYKNVDSYYYNLEKELFTKSDDGKQYVMKNWFVGRECDVKNVEDLRRTAKELARLHLALNVVDTASINYEPPYVSESKKQYNWESMATEEADNMIYAASANNISQNQQEDIRTTYTRHLNELKKIGNYLKRKKNKTEYEQMVVKAMTNFYEEAENAVDSFSNKDFDDRFKLAVDRGELAHGAFNYHDIIFDVNDKKDCVITGFEHCKNTCQIIDLYQFLRKVLEKHNWNLETAYAVIDEYDRIKPLQDVELDIILMLLSFPEKFWKLVNQYFNSSKSWIPAKNIDKLKVVIEQNVKRRELIDKISGLC